MNNVSQLKASVKGLLQGININQVTNPDEAIERAARTLLQQADVPEASLREGITLYSGVYDYPAPDSIFGGAINDLRPQGIVRTPLDVVYRKPIELFDRTKAFLPNGYGVTFEYYKGDPIMRVAQNFSPARVVIDSMSETTGWSVGGSASGLAQDISMYYQEPASLRFTLTASSSGYIEKTLTNAIDLSEYDGVGVVFLALRTPSATNLTNASIRIGSSSSDYYTVTETEGFLGAWWVDEFFLVALDLAGASATGSPDFSAVDYVRLTFAHTATITNIRVGYLFTALPSAHELFYQSTAIFQNASTGVLSRTIGADSDNIILGDAAYLLLEHETALTMAFQSGGGIANPVVQKLQAILHGSGNDVGLYKLYRADNPSEEIRSVGSWY